MSLQDRLRLLGQKNVIVPSKVTQGNQQSQEEREDAELEKLLEESDQPTEEETNRFLNGTGKLDCGSSNISWIKFFPQTNELLVKFIKPAGTHGSDPYCFSSSVGEAKSFAGAGSKGKFFRAQILGRGFRRVPAFYTPKTV